MNYLEKSCKVTPDFGNITHSSSFTIANQQLSGFITIGIRWISHENVWTQHESGLTPHESEWILHETGLMQHDN